MQAASAGTQSLAIPLNQQELEQKRFRYKDDDSAALKRKPSSKSQAANNIYAAANHRDENRTNNHLENPYTINEQHLHQHHHHQLYQSSTYATNNQQPYLHEQKVNSSTANSSNTAEYCWREESLPEENQHEQVTRLDQSSASALFNSSASLEGQLSYRASGQTLQGRAEVSNDFKQHQASGYPQPLWPDELITETGNSHARFASSAYQSSGPASDDELKLTSEKQQQPTSGQQTVVDNAGNEYNQLR